MPHHREAVAGALFFIASAQFILSIIIAEALYPGYSIFGNYISDLGVGPSSVIFNSSIFLMGLTSIFGAYFLPPTSSFRVLIVLLVLMGIGAMGAAVFTKEMPVLHAAVSSMAFMFAGLSAVASFKALRTPLSVTSVVLGVMSLGALALFAGGLITTGLFESVEAQDSVFFLGIGPGGMERMIIYPALSWLLGFSGYLMAQSEEKAQPT